VIIIPYIKQERRPALDKVVAAMVDYGICDENGVVSNSKLSILFSHLVDNILSRPDMSDVYNPIYTDNHHEIVDLMIDSGLKLNGDLNYILFKFAKYHIKPSYNNYKMFISALEYTVFNTYDSSVYIINEVILNLCGELNECVSEIRRKILGPYEEKAIERNGDV